MVPLRARVLASRSGHFGDKDPVRGSPERVSSLHAYSYVGASPIRYADPKGETQAEVILGLRLWKSGVKFAIAGFTGLGNAISAADEALASTNPAVRHEQCVQAMIINDLSTVAAIVGLLTMAMGLMIMTISAGGYVYQAMEGVVGSAVVYQGIVGGLAAAGVTLLMYALLIIISGFMAGMLFFQQMLEAEDGIPKLRECGRIVAGTAS